MPICGHAQYPATGARSFSFGISGLANIGVTPNASRAGSVLFRKYKSDKTAMRYSLGFSATDNGYTAYSPNGIANFNNTLYFNLNIGAGFQHTLANLSDRGLSKLQVYWGVDFTLGGTYLQSKYTSNFILDPSRIPGAVYGDYSRSITTNITPLRIGVFPLVGAQYFLRENISIGVEFFDGLSAGFLQTQKVSYEDVRAGVKTTSPAFEIDNGSFNLQDNLGGLLMGTIFF